MLETKSFDAVIAEGRIYREESLRSWEGRTVAVTLLARLGEEPPDEIAVEKEVYIKVPVKTSVVRSAKVRDAGHAKPSFILPEGLEDE